MGGLCGRSCAGPAPPPPAPTAATSPHTVVPQDNIDPCAAALRRAEHAAITAADVRGRQEALPRRFRASLDSANDFFTSLKADLDGEGREAVWASRVLSANAFKVLEGAAEEARVRAAQLDAYAAILEDEEEWREAEATAVALLSSEGPGYYECASVVLEWDAAATVRIVEASLRLRDGVDVFSCEVRGAEGGVFIPGTAAVLSVAAVDRAWERVERLEAGDVSVCVDGGTVSSVEVNEAGRVEVAYALPVDRVQPVTVCVSVCGSPLPGSPWQLTCMLGDSMILGFVPGDTRAAFLRALSWWLAGRRYGLLYRGSRDGMTAASFHRLCDGQGPTLVLVRSANGYTFGGYAGVSRAGPVGKRRANQSYRTVTTRLCSVSPDLFKMW